MNIQDFEAPPAPPLWREIVETIFDGQRHLMDRYKEIEKLPNAPVSLHHASGQKILKDFAWRVTEELTESFEAVEKHLEYGTEDHIEHRNEEMADSLHFLVELMIFAGIPAQQCADAPILPRLARTDWEIAYWRAVYELGLAMNFLRNKPWKQSQVPTDEGRFRSQLIKAWSAHVCLWFTLGLNAEMMYAYYFRKNQVNQFRQRSQY